MKSRWTHIWKGFEIQPEGCLLDQVVDPSTEMGIAYERSCHFYKDFHSHDRPIFVFPRESCRMEVRVKNPSITFEIDETSALMIPAGVIHDDKGLSAIYDTFALLPDPTLFLELGKKQPLSAAQIKTTLSTTKKFKRTKQLNQLLHFYFYERIVAQASDPEDCRYLEKKLLEEWVSILQNMPQAVSQQFNHKDSIAARSIKFIEANLFSDLNSEVLFKHVGASRATLFRSFREETGLSPYHYIKQRRLEEAKRLLHAGGRSVSQIAMLVGYENFGAFSEAFKDKFKSSPSTYLKRDSRNL